MSPGTFGKVVSIFKVLLTKPLCSHVPSILISTRFARRQLKLSKKVTSLRRWLEFAPSVFEAEVAAEEPEKAEEHAEPTQSKVKPRPKPKSLIERLDIFLVPIELRSANSLDPQVNQLGTRASDRGFLNMTLEEYIQLLEYVGKLIHPNKRGKIVAEAESILNRLNINPATFERAIDPRNKLFKRGTRVQLAEVAAA